MELSARAKRIKESATMAVAAKAKEMRRNGIDVISFGLGEPDFDTPEHIKQAAREALAQGKTKYTPASGIPELREVICEKLKNDHGLDYAPAQITVSNGAKHALHNVMTALLNPGDEVIVIAPYWVSYPELVRLADGEPVIIDAAEDNDFKVTPQQLEAAVTERTRALIMNYPSNPTGSVYSRQELEGLAEVVKRHQLVVLTDEIYEKLVFGDTQFVSFAAVDPALMELTVTINGVSKSYAMTGWRIGYTAAPANLAKAMGQIQSQETSNPCSISQWAAVAALTGDQSCVEHMRQQFQQRRDYVIERLNGMPGVTCCCPEGAFYAFPNVAGHFNKTLGGTAVNSSLDFCGAALEVAHIAIVPGEAFGAPNNIRLSFANSMEQIQEGLDRLEKLIQG